MKKNSTPTLSLRSALLAFLAAALVSHAATAPQSPVADSSPPPQGGAYVLPDVREGKLSTLFEESVVWEDHENGFDPYHVYGLTVTDKGTVLAFSEARVRPNDDDPHHLVMKRSTDLGRTWSASTYLERSDGSFWKTQNVEGRLECWTNTSAVATRSGRVFFFYALNEGSIEGKNLQRYTRVFYRFSDDDGLTWSPRVEVTGLLNVKADGTPNKDAAGKWILDRNGNPSDYLGRSFHMPGPGHGIQLRGGRVLVSFWNRQPIGRDDGSRIPGDQRNYNVSLIYSDDDGRTWASGPSLGQEVSAVAGANEQRIVELDNGEIYLNARGHEMSDRRWIFRGSENGMKWKLVGMDREMPVFFGTDAGLTSARFAGKQVLLFSHPRAPEWRGEMTVSASFDEGKTWPIHKTLNGDASTYSDLVTLPDGTVGLIYGRGWTRLPGYKGRSLFPQRVAFARFNLEWLGLPKLTQ